MNFWGKGIKKIYILLFAFLMIAEPFFVWAAGQYEAGSLLVSDRDKAVYYIGDDLKKYIFPDAKTYFTWFNNFAGIFKVSVAELDQYEDGGVVPYRAGTKLVTHQNTAKVYAVEPGGLLRWIPSDTVASYLYGQNWQSLVQDIISGFFATSYSVGDDLADLLPDGTIVTDRQQQDYYILDNGKRRPFSSLESFYNNLLDFDNTIVLDSLDDYPLANNISSREKRFSDPSYKHTPAIDDEFDNNDNSNENPNPPVDDGGDNNDGGSGGGSGSSGDDSSGDSGNDQPSADDGGDENPEPLVDDYDFSYPFQIFLDNTSVLDNQGYTDAEHQEIAGIGFGMWPVSRIFTPTGRAQINAIKVYNPNFKVLGVYDSFHVSPTDPGHWRPFAQDKYNIFNNHFAFHEDGSYLVAWPDPAISSLYQRYWFNPLPASEGYTYNRQLLLAELDLFSRYNDQYSDLKLEGVWHDYFSYIPWVWPSQTAEHGLMDLDQDGITFQYDNDEILAWRDYQRDLSAGLNDIFGPLWKNIYNGRIAIADYSNIDLELMANGRGALLEAFPRLPWNYTDERILDVLVDTTRPGYYSTDPFGRYWNIMNIKNSFDLPLARISSMVFLQPYIVLRSVPGDIGYYGAWGDDYYNHGILAGQPIGDLEISVSEQGGKKYQRDFQNGCARIETDSTENAVVYEFVDTACNYQPPPPDDGDGGGVNCTRDICPST